MRGID